MSVDQASFRSAMARFPGAVTVITALSGPEAGAERRGITATAVCSVSADPPSLLVCVNRATGTRAAIHETGRFNVNLLAKPDDLLAMQFAGQGGVTGEEKFAWGDWNADSRGLPRLASALLCFSCDVSEATEAGSHTVFIGRITDIAQGEGEPLLYERSGFQCLAPI
ncbi:flavin reductase family protein [Phaeobacter sp. QD34_3]|uniref:flavin reductase family protein n=1 Tax=unclassified Phaeobacter TaxID=2621772 RepID=UPI00237F2DB5|nr:MULTISPECIES: flavin reductase family protein [unclassified Phaeobacter]MDE4132744.1 flavin reductase family protein [Phaeobacter sp. QD34_3]MDE4136463.1 flavin reductase family protein [Phaeobacter sp. QD34_24]